MIAKGTTHNNGLRLAIYITTGKEGERAELGELRGFGADNIKDAFRDVHIMAEATQCEQPFFHVQVRNPEGENLSRQQWRTVANRIESILGLKDQPRAVAFHISEKNGDEHMHVAWSRIDEDTLKAKPLPFFKERLKKVSRELELHFGLTLVRNEREGVIKFAPTRAEGEHARRNGLDIHDVRNTIRQCFDHSDCGASFQAALEYEGLTLAQGDRRAFVVLDQAGGIHALGKRILDVTAAQVNARLSDISRDTLLTVEQVRTATNDLQIEKSKEKREPIWDRDRADNHWQEAVINAAIEKEKHAREFIEPNTPEKERPGGRKEERERVRDEHWPIAPVEPETKHWTAFARAGVEAGRDNRSENLNGEAARVWQAWRESDNSKAFAAALDEKGISFARVTDEEASRSEREAAFAKAIGNKAPRFHEGEIVIVTETRLEYRRHGEIVEPSRIHKLDQSPAEKFTSGLGHRHRLQGIDDTVKASDVRAGERAADLEVTRLERATRFGKGREDRNIRTGKTPDGALERSGLRVVAKALDVVSDVFDSLLAPKLTPEQKHAGHRAKQEREAEGDISLDQKAAAAEVAQRRQQELENEAERARQRDRDRGGRDR